MFSTSSLSFALLARAAACFLLSSLLSASVLVSALSVNRRADVCNGHAELCSRSYGNVSFVGSHNSYAVDVNNIGANQDYDVTQQLNDGIRLLQVQVHNQDGTLQLCHTSCTIFNGGSLADYLGKVNSWLMANPNEVVSILMVNIDNVAVAQYDSVYQAASLSNLAYAPTSASLPATDWPSLGELIDTGRRLVVFMDNGADSASVPYIIDEFSNIWETEFGVTTQFDCNVNRTNGDTTTQMYLINHFLDKLIFGQTAPDVDNANTTNAAEGTNSLGEHVDMCNTQHVKAPNFMLVDFYEYGGGSVFQVAAGINAVQYNPATPIATPRSTAASASSSSTGDNSAPASLVTSAGLLTNMMVLVSMLFGASMVI